MNLNKNHTRIWAPASWVVAAGLALAAPALAQQAHDHGAHGAHEAATPADGPWSYLGRDNPEPHTEDRWVMIPVPGEAHAFRFVREVEARAVCASLDERRVMVDRATRAACEAQPEGMPFQGVAQAPGHGGHGDGGHDGHEHHEHGHHGHGHGHGDHGADGGHGHHDGQGNHDHGGAADAPPATAPAEQDTHRH